MDMEHRFIVAIMAFFVLIAVFAMPAEIMSHAPINKSQGEQVYKGDDCIENEYMVSKSDIEKYGGKDGDMEKAIKAKKINPSHRSPCISQ
ncbi:hypothetical protein [Glutamicibacter ardleyensis]|uniref:hypothetical protein n=1 Tax=Glutamicibacter ardleyensis TaxID=225894 RepID=UPI003FD5D149